MGVALEPTFEADFTFANDEPFRLVAGGSLQPVTLRYAVYSELNEARDNAVLVCHALSGSARVADWWPQLFGPNQPFDTTQYYVIGVNVIGSCYGSTGALAAPPLKTGPIRARDFSPRAVKQRDRTTAPLYCHSCTISVY